MGRLRSAYGRMLAVGLVVALAAAACSPGDGEDRGAGPDGGTDAEQEREETRVEGGTATMAMFLGNPTYIFPILSVQYVTAANTTHFIPLMFKPLFQVDENLELDWEDSLAQEPEFSDDRQTMTLRLNEWAWSDGEPLTARDVEFSFNLIRHNKGGFAGYIEGFFPDNVAELEIPDEQTLVFHLTEPVSTRWFVLNQIGNVVPLPHHAWSKTSADGEIGDHDRDPEAAVQVFEFLSEQARNVDTYATNPLWETVSGAWRLDRFDPEGNVEFVPNDAYPGQYPPSLDRFVMQPFTSAVALLSALRSGTGPDIGGIPYSQLDQAPSIENLGYEMHRWPSFGFNYIVLSMAEPTAGPIFRQTYFRQALQHLVDQESIIEAGFRGEGWPNYGPVPYRPENPYYDDSAEEAAPKFDPGAARELLESHGWEVDPDGVTTCQRPGDGEDQCGEGIPSGAQAAFTLRSVAQPQTANEVTVQSFQSEARRLGIRIEIDTQPFNTVYATTAVCAFAEDACDWQMSFFDGWGYGGGYPSGEFLFRTGGTANFGRYSDPTNDENVEATIRDDSEENMARYQAYLAEQVPVIYVPGGFVQFPMIRTNLRGVTPLIPSLAIRPERWYFVEE